MRQVVVMFHCGSRGFWHQVASDYLQQFLRVGESKYHIRVADRELASAPFNSPEGKPWEFWVGKLKWPLLAEDDPSYE
jgi:tRNA-splicing ligase RtcB (3'-phosphate/5'-hydroxy nucleic acid ligase)